MHTFPCARPRRLLAACAVVASIGALTLPLGLMPSAEAKQGASHHRSLQDKQKHVRTQEKKVQGSLDGESKELTQAQAALTSAQHQLTAARSHLAEVAARLATARRADARLRAQLAQARARLAQARAAMAAGATDVNRQRTAAQRAVLDSYEQGDPSLGAAQSLMDGQPLDAASAQQAYGMAVNSMQMNSYQSLQASQALLVVRTQDVGRATAAVAGREKAAAAKVAQVNSLRNQAKDAADAVRTLVSSRRTATQEAAAAKVHDEKRLKGLQAKDAKLQTQILASVGHAANRTVSTAHGLFMSPVANTYITSPYGWRLNPVMHYWGLHDGDDLHAPCGTPEVAVGPGKVMAEYYSDVWGNRLFFDLGEVNGHHWAAIYNHITAYKAHVGDVVPEGGTLAFAGTTGWSTGCHLHFTLTRDGTAVDPTSLIGLG